MIYVYAVIDEHSLPDNDVRGLAGTHLFVVPEGTVAAVCSAHARLDGTPEAAHLWAHERVTAALMPHCSVAPVRFGTVVSDVAQVRSLLASLHPRLVEALGRVRGKVELAVRATVPVNVIAPAPAPAPAPASPRDSATGREYLRARCADASNRAAFELPAALADLHTTLSARAEASTASARPVGWLSASYLVAPEEIPCMRRAVIEARRIHPDMRVSLTGPWAAFSFVNCETLANA